MIEIEGLSELNAKFTQLAKIATETAKSELADIAMDLGSKSSDRAPIELGDLRGDLARPQKEDDFTWAVGSGLPYAVRQHEHTEYNHPRGGEAKFLEKSFNENQQKYIDEISDAIARALGI